MTRLNLNLREHEDVHLRRDLRSVQRSVNRIASSLRGSSKQLSEQGDGAGTANISGIETRSVVSPEASAYPVQVNSKVRVIVNSLGKDVDTQVRGDTDANLLYIDAGNDRVGIGTNTPAYKLDVNGTFHSTGIALLDNEKIILGTGSDSEIYYDGTDLILEPDAVGSGAVKVTGELELPGSAATPIGSALWFGAARTPVGAGAHYMFINSGTFEFGYIDSSIQAHTLSFGDFGSPLREGTVNLQGSGIEGYAILSSEMELRRNALKFDPASSDVAITTTANSTGQVTWNLTDSMTVTDNTASPVGDLLKLRYAHSNARTILGIESTGQQVISGNDQVASITDRGLSGPLIAASVSTVTKSNAGSPTVTISGTYALAAAVQAKVRIVLGGARGVATFVWALSNAPAIGVGWNAAGQEVPPNSATVTAASVPISTATAPTGLNVDFPTGNYTANDEYTFTVSPQMNTVPVDSSTSLTRFYAVDNVAGANAMVFDTENVIGLGVEPYVFMSGGSWRGKIGESASFTNSVTVIGGGPNSLPFYAWLNSGVAAKMTLDSPNGYLELDTDLRFDDSGKLLFGDSADAEVYYDGTNLVLDPKAVGSGVVDIQGNLSIGDNSATDPTVTFNSTTGNGAISWDDNLQQFDCNNDWRFDGALGIGTNPTTTNMLRISDFVTSTTNRQAVLLTCNITTASNNKVATGIIVRSAHNSAAAGNEAKGGQFSARLQGQSGATSVLLRGGEFIADTTGSPQNITCTEVTAGYFDVNMSYSPAAANTYSNIYGRRLGRFAVASGNTITNAYGDYICDVTDLSVAPTVLDAIHIEAQDGTQRGATFGNVRFAGSGYQAGHLQMGDTHLWEDGSNNLLRFKGSAPGSDTDGVGLGDAGETGAQTPTLSANLPAAAVATASATFWPVWIGATKGWVPVWQ